MGVTGGLWRAPASLQTSFDETLRQYDSDANTASRVT